MEYMIERAELITDRHLNIQKFLITALKAHFGIDRRIDEKRHDVHEAKQTYERNESIHREAFRHRMESEEKYVFAETTGVALKMFDSLVRRHEVLMYKKMGLSTISKLNGNMYTIG